MAENADFESMENNIVPFRVANHAIYARSFDDSFGSPQVSGTK